MTSVEESLARLKLDRVDILHIHDPDDHYDAALGGAYRALAKLRQEGVIGAIGAGMNQWQMLQRFAEDARFRLLSARRPLHAPRPLGGGEPSSALREEVDLGHRRRRLQQRHPRRSSGRRQVQLRRRPSALVAKALRLEAICRAHGVPLKAAAIQFPFTHPAVGAVLTGARSEAGVPRESRDVRNADRACALGRAARHGLTARRGRFRLRAR